MVQIPDHPVIRELERTGGVSWGRRYAPVGGGALDAPERETAGRPKAGPYGLSFREKRRGAAGGGCSRDGFPQRSKNASKSVSAQRFSGTARCVSEARRGNP